MRRNDSFGERGIVRLHGYGSEQWRVDPGFAVRIPPGLGDLGVLLEPASVLAKAGDQVDQISRRGFFVQGKALVTTCSPPDRDFCSSITAVRSTKSPIPKPTAPTCG